MRVYALLIIAILASLIAGCSEQNQTNHSDKNAPLAKNQQNTEEAIVLEGADIGLLNVFVKPENNSFLYSDWAVNSIMLIRKDGGLVSLAQGNPSEMFKLPLSDFSNKPYLLSQMPLPKGEYVGMMISLNVDSSLFSFLTDGGVRVSTLFNEDGRVFTGEYPIETVMVSFGVINVPNALSTSTLKRIAAGVSPTCNT